MKNTRFFTLVTMAAALAASPAFAAPADNSNSNDNSVINNDWGGEKKTGSSLGGWGEDDRAALEKMQAAQCEEYPSICENSSWDLDFDPLAGGGEYVEGYVGEDGQPVKAEGYIPIVDNGKVLGLQPVTRNADGELELVPFNMLPDANVAAAYAVHSVKQDGRTGGSGETTFDMLSRSTPEGSDQLVNSEGQTMNLTQDQLASLPRSPAPALDYVPDGFDAGGEWMMNPQGAGWVYVPPDMMDVPEPGKDDEFVGPPEPPEEDPTQMGVEDVADRVGETHDAQDERRGQGENQVEGDGAPGGFSPFGLPGSEGDEPIARHEGRGDPNPTTGGGDTGKGRGLTCKGDRDCEMAHAKSYQDYFNFLAQGVSPSGPVNPDETVYGARKKISALLGGEGNLSGIGLSRSAAAQLHRAGENASQAVGNAYYDDGEQRTFVRDGTAEFAGRGFDTHGSQDLRKTIQTEGIDEGTLGTTGGRRVSGIGNPDGSEIESID